MINVTNRRSNASPPADLLPWADPYILQLFAAAELVDSQAEELEGRIDMHSRMAARGEANFEAVFSGDAWRLATLHRTPAARRRSSAPARQLAPC